jgi:hypothetical protein
MARPFLSRRALLGGAAAAAAAFGAGHAMVAQRARLRAPPRADAVRLAPPADAGARLPRLTAHPDGDVLLSWVEPYGAGHALRYARYDGGRWTAAVEVARGERWFVNWIDFASVVAIDREFWIAHWLVRREGGGKHAYDIALALSTDRGRTWRRGPRPYHAQAAAEFGFVSIFADGDDAGLVWLDGRDYVKASERHVHPGRSGKFALRYARVARDGGVRSELVLDGNVCSCCQTAAAVAGAVPLVAYRARTDAEVRDVKVLRRVHQDWSAAADLGAEGWTIAACPTNGPALAARGQRVAAIWFTAAGDRPRVRAAFSSDAGVRWSRPQEIDAQAPIGRVAAAWIDDQRAAFSWIGAPAAGRAPLMIAVFDGRGRERVRYTVAQVAASRDSGIPQLASVRGRLIVAFTEPGPDFGIRVDEIAAPLSWTSTRTA